MRICLISSGFLPCVDGVTVTQYERVRLLSEWGHDVLVFTPDYSMLPAVYPDHADYGGNIFPNVQVVPLPSDPIMGMAEDRHINRKGLRRLRNELLAFRPELIHVDEPERLLLGLHRRAGLREARQAGIPIVASMRTNFQDYLEDYLPRPAWLLASVRHAFGKLVQWTYNGYDRTIVSSQHVFSRMPDYGIRNAVYGQVLGSQTALCSPSRRRPDYFREVWGLDGVDATVKLLFLGRLMPDKNWRFTLAHLAKLAGRTGRPFSILIAGAGPMADEIAERLAPLGEHLHMLGRVHPSRVPDLMANCDLHVTASLKETKGQTALEALASGVPVVAPDCSWAAELIDHGQSGLLYDPGDGEAFIGTLVRAIDDQLARAAWSARAHESATAFASDEPTRRWLTLLQDTLQVRD